MPSLMVLTLPLVLASAPGPLQLEAPSFEVPRPAPTLGVPALIPQGQVNLSDEAQREAAAGAVGLLGGLACASVVAIVAVGALVVVVGIAMYLLVDFALSVGGAVAMLDEPLSLPPAPAGHPSGDGPLPDAIPSAGWA